jgi:tRNA(fMet)-specific endonuclease VapC
MTPPTILDTDVLSAVMRQHPRAVVRSKAYLVDHPRFAFSLISRYEILRGLKVSGATSRLKAFEQFCAASDVLPVSDSAVELAADIYADLHRRGLLIGDADILIAATALEHGFIVATNNEAHFRRVNGLTVDNWLK